MDEVSCAVAVLHDAHPPLVVVEVGPAAAPVVHVTAPVVGAPSAHGDIAVFALKDHWRGAEVLAPVPDAHRPRIARGREGAGAAVRANKDGVAVSVGYAGLRLRDREAEGRWHECLRGEIELADDAGVGPAARELHEAEVLGLGRAQPQGRAALPDPGHALRRRQGIDVEHWLPSGGGLPELLEGGPPPQAADVGLVLPEVVDVPSAHAHRGDLRRGLQQLLELRQQGRGGGIADRCQRAGILGAHPAHDPRVVHHLEPPVRVAEVRAGQRPRRPGLAEEQQSPNASRCLAHAARFTAVGTAHAQG
mmetsp:Transcript_55402/g.173793  ORF Transcript_55402/g.173793 Transcript_55402/m.173793 type:complete len:306 (+) Transcript_55402:1576-2493(+)